MNRVASLPIPTPDQRLRGLRAGHPFERGAALVEVAESTLDDVDPPVSMIERAESSGATWEPSVPVKVSLTLVGSGPPVQTVSGEMAGSFSSSFWIIPADGL